MKFFNNKTAAFIAALMVTSVAMAQQDAFTSQKNANQTGAGDTTVVIENVKGKPGVAILKTSGLIMNVLSDEKMPEGYKTQVSKPDDSDKSKTANLGTFADNPSFAQHKLCWRGVGRKGWHQMSCSTVSAKGVAKHQVVTAARNEVIVLTPELQSAKGEHVAWVSHPAEVRKYVHCDGKSQQASAYFVDNSGLWRAATEAEVKKYDEEEYGKACKDAA